MRQKLDYIYFRFYRFQVAVGNATVAVPFAYLFIVFLLVLNLLSITSTLYGLFGIKLLADNGLEKAFSIAFLLFVLSFFLFIYRGRYKKIIATYKMETKQASRKGNLFVCLYVVLTFLMMGIGFYLMILRNNR